MPIRIQTYGSFFKERRANVAMVSGVVFGIAVLIFLNFLFFSITGHREFIWLGVAQGCFALNTVLAEGYIAIFFLSDRPLAINALEQIFKCGFAAAMAQFARSFIDTPVHFPPRDPADRKTAVEGKGVSVTVDLGVRRTIKKKKKQTKAITTV